MEQKGENIDISGSLPTGNRQNGRRSGVCQRGARWVRKDIPTSAVSAFNSRLQGLNKALRPGCHGVAIPMRKANSSPGQQ